MSASQPGGGILAGLGAHHRLIVDAAGRAAAGRGWKCCLVGGAVRDLLLGREVGQLDLLVEGDAGCLAGDLAGALQAKRRMQSRFATASVRLPDGEVIDVAAARTETYASPAALPVVSPGRIEEDLDRRDFTVNAIAVHLTPESFGEILDPRKGRCDLEGRLIRVLHDRSFTDDPTRALRAVRLSRRLGFEIEPRTRRLISETAPASFSRLTADRLHNELQRMLREMAPGQSVRALEREGILEAVLRQPVHASPDPDLLERVDRLVRELGAAVPQGAILPLPLLVWGCGIHDAARCAALLGMRHEERILVGRLAGASRLAEAVGQPGLARSGIYFALHDRRLEEIVAAAAVDPSILPRVRLHLGELLGVETLLRGEDLLRLGIAPGPRIGETLRRILAARLDGLVRTKEEEEALAREIADGGGAV